MSIQSLMHFSTLVVCLEISEIKPWNKHRHYITSCIPRLFLKESV